MLFRFVFVLIPVAVSAQLRNEFGKRESPRRFRQLDLGFPTDTSPPGRVPEVIGPSSDENIRPLNNGYLPPVSLPPPSSPPLRSEQSRTVEVKPTEKENLVCQEPGSCNPGKGSSGTPRPSKILVPPPDELQRNDRITTANSKSVSPFKAISTQSTVTTTKKPVTKKLVTTTQKPSVKPLKVRQEAVMINAAEQSVESRNYLPPLPEFSAAAQTPQAVVRPAAQKEEEPHHHHHHHHDENFDICSDPFHSFLCAPLKARKRITGAFPESLRGQNSFVQYQRVQPDRAAPMQSQPVRIGAPSNRVVSTTSRAVTTAAPTTISYTTPNLIPAPSFGSENYYLPPVQGKERIVFEVLSKPDSSNTIENSVKISGSTVDNSLVFTGRTSPQSKLSNEFNSIFSSTTSTEKASVTSGKKPSPKIHSSTLSISSTPEPWPQVAVTSNKGQSHSFSTTYSQPSSIPASSATRSPSVSNSKNFSTLPVKQSTSPLSTVSTVVLPPVGTNSADQGIATFVEITGSQFTSGPRFAADTRPPAESASSRSRPQAPSASQPSTLAFRPVPTSSQFGSTPLRSTSFTGSPTASASPLPSVSSRSSSFPVRVSPFASQFSASSTVNLISTTAKPVISASEFHSSTLDSLTTPNRDFRKSPSTFSSFASQSSNLENSYLPPDAKVPSPANIIPSTHKPSATTTTTEKPETIASKSTEQLTLSYLPPQPFEPAAAQVDVVVAAPQNPVHHGRDLCTDPFHSFLCSGPKPRKRITGARPSGVDAETSNIDLTVLKAAPTFQRENLIKPETIDAQKPSPGYKYPVPKIPVPQSSNVSPTSAEPEPTPYVYPKPEKIFSLPSEQEPATEATTLRPTTPRPTTPRPTTPRPTTPRPTTRKSTIAPSSLIPSEAKIVIGYDYPKPEKPFPLPTEQKPVTAPSSTPPAPSTLPPTNQFQGYSYPKPAESLQLPQKQGYFYPKPEKRLELPNEDQINLLFRESSTPLNVFPNLGSAEFIPVNKLDKRNALRLSTHPTRTYAQ